MELEELILLHFARKQEDLDRESRLVFEAFLTQLDTGRIRAAGKQGENWEVNRWVKQGILLGFRLGEVVDYSINQQFQFRDKDTFPLKDLSSIPHPVRVVPGGSAIRTGAYLGRGVTVMPPAYINVGAYVDDDSMIDSHALVGSCAQVGKRVHLSAASQIGGVLEPVGTLPVVIEDDVLVGGNCGIYEGTLIQSGAVIGAGTILTGSTPVYDLVHGKILRKSGNSPLVIPQNAVLVPGSRPVRGSFAAQHEIHISTPVIIKYRDQATSAVTALEDLLR